MRAKYRAGEGIRTLDVHLGKRANLLKTSRNSIGQIGRHALKCPHVYSGAQAWAGRWAERPDGLPPLPTRAEVRR